MNKTLLIFLIIALSCIGKIKGQDLIALDSVLTFNYYSGHVRTLNSNDCSNASLDNNNIAYSFLLTDLTLHENFIYGVGDPIGTEDFNFIRAVLSPLGGLPFFDVPADVATALASDPTGNIILAGDGLQKYSVNDETLETIGILPSFCQMPQAMSYRLGQFFIITQDNKVVKINPTDATDIQIMFELPSDFPIISGFTTSHNSCEDVVSYIHTSGTVGKLWELDFENQAVIEICENDLMIMATVSYTELAVFDECQIIVDLDEDDSTINSLLDYQSDTLCSPPSSIVDVDVSLFSEVNFLDSIVIEITAGIQDLGNEYLTYSGLEGLTVNSNNTQKITLINSGSNTIEDFRTGLLNTLYNNSAPQISYGTREVSFIAYASDYSSDVAIAYLPFYSIPLLFDADITNISCFGENDGSLDLILDAGVSPYEVEWNAGATTESINQLSPDTYYVTVTDGSGCIGMDSFIISEPTLLEANIDNLGENIVCDASATLTALEQGGTSPYNYLWDNQTTSELNENLSFGWHYLTVTDANGCQDTASWYIDTDTTLVNLSQTICSGEQYVFGGLTLERDTNLCVVFNDIEGCDSTVCLALMVIDTFYTEEILTFCVGDTAWINNDFYLTNETVCIEETAINGCDSTSCINLVFNNTTEYLTESICQGGVYQFGNQELNSEGVYYDTLTNSLGCDSLIELNLSFYSNPDLEIIQIGSLCEGGNVFLETSTNYPQYTWSNGSTNNSIMIESSGIYSVTVTDDTGCIFNSEIELNEDLIEAEISTTDLSCFQSNDGLITIDTTYGGTEPYLFSLNGGSFTGNTSFQNLATGIYELTVEDADGCQNSYDIEIGEPNPIGLYLEPEVILELGDSLYVQPTTANLTGAEIQWTPLDLVSCDTCLQTYLKPFETTRYTVSVTDENGCMEEAVTTVIVDRNIGIFAPTAFSPNNDGINDIFYLQSKNDLVINHFRVFDRWGGLVFENTNGLTNDTAFGWNGEFKSQVVRGGVYVWTVEVVLPDGVIQIISGDVGLF